VEFGVILNTMRAASGGTSLRYEQTVPCSLAHRRAVGEVFVTDSAKVDDSSFLTAIQLPRAHSLWGDRITNHHDSLAVIEAGRQATFLTVHRYLGVPLGVPFILRHVAFRVSNLAAFVDNHAEPFEGVICITLLERSEKQGVLTSLTFRGEMLVGQISAMSMGGEIQFLQRRDYDSLRAFVRKQKKVEGRPIPPAPAPIEPALIGRRNRHNVAIGQGRQVGDQYRYPLIIDITHPCFFDHPQDHVPGPLILEAYRQSAILTAQRYGALASPQVAVTSGHLTFLEFGEFEEIAECTAEVIGPGADGGVDVRVGLRQLDVEIATAVFGLTACE
jgi:hypothetical protein